MFCQVLEKWFSREVTHIITNREGKKLPTQNAKKNEAKDRPLFNKMAQSPSDGQIESLSPFADSPFCDTDIVSRPMTRGQAIVQRATVMKNLGSTNVVECARLWGIKVIHVDAAEKWLRKEVERFGVRKGKSKAKVMKLRQPFVKVEDSSLRFSPEYKQLQFFPTVKFDAPKGCCPFGRRFGAGSVLRSSGGPMVMLEKIDFDEKKLGKFRERLGNGSESLLSKEDRLLTAGELQRLNGDRKAAVVRIRGVCEMCNVIYSNIFQHLRTERHKMYVEDDQNYRTLDHLIDQFKTIGGNSQSVEYGTATGKSETNGEDSKRHRGFLSLPGSRVMVAAGEEDGSSDSTDENRQYAVRNIPEKKQREDIFVENINEISAECIHRTKKDASLRTITEQQQQKASVIRSPDDQASRSQRRQFESDDRGNPRDVVSLSGCDEISDMVVELSDLTVMSGLSSELPVIRPIQSKRHDFQVHSKNAVFCDSQSGDCYKQRASAKSEAQTGTEAEHVLPCVELQKVRRIELPRPVPVVTNSSMQRLFESDRSSSDFQGFSEASDSIIDEMSYCEVSQATFDTDLNFDCLEKSVSGCVSGMQLFAPSSDEDFVLEDAQRRDAGAMITHAAIGNGLVSKEKIPSPKSYSSAKSSFSTVEPLSAAAKRVRGAEDTLGVKASQNSSRERSITLTENLQYSKRLSWQPKVRLVPYDCKRRYAGDRSNRICKTSQPHVRVVRCDGLRGNLDGSFNRIHEDTSKQCCSPLEIDRSRFPLKQIPPEDDRSKRHDGCYLPMNLRNKKKGESEYRCSLGVRSEGLLSSSNVDTISKINSETSSTSLYQLVDRKDETFTPTRNTKGTFFPVASRSFIEVKVKKLVSAKERVFDEDDSLVIIEDSDKADGFRTRERESARFGFTSAKRNPPLPVYRVCHKRKWQPFVALEDFTLTHDKRL